MRFVVFALVLGALTACAPAVPDSGPKAGVGFSNYTDYLEEREVAAAEARRQRYAVATGAGAQPGAGAITSGPIGAAPATGQASAPATQYQRAAAPAGIAVVDSEVAGSAELSDEQDFAAVSSRETIESDKLRLEQLRQQYQQVTPTALPERTKSDAPDIIAFALGTRNAVGEQVYKRSGKLLTAEALGKRCARFGSPDHAQETFLKSGGPKRDTKGIDPDGDGFACFWDPTPYRNALR